MPPKAKAQSGIAADIAAMKLIGMTDDAIRDTIHRASNPIVHVPADGGAPTVLAPQPALTAPQRQDRANLGPDPELVARLAKFNETYQPAVLEETFEVTLKKRYVDYVNRYAAMISARRPNSEPIGPEKAIELIVMAYRQVDPDRALMEGARGRTAPAALPPGQWAQKTA